MMDALRARLPPCAVSNIVVNQHSDLGTTSSHLTFYVQHLQAPNRPQITPNLIRSPPSRHYWQRWQHPRVYPCRRSSAEQRAGAHNGSCK